MINVVIKISLLLLLNIYLFGEEYSYNSIINNNIYKIYDIDINKDNIQDKVAYNIQGNELLFYINVNDKYKKVYNGNNYSLDGIYKIKNLKKPSNSKYVLQISTLFTGSGGQLIDYFISYNKNKWILEKRISITSSYNFNPNKTKVCEWYRKDDSEKCFIKNVQSLIEVSKQPLYKTPPEKTKMYLIKGNKVEVLEEKDDWLYILYKGKKDIKAWIPKESIK